MKKERPRSKLSGGTSGAGPGATSAKGSPSDPVRESSSGLKDRRPARDIAVMISGLAMKFMVSERPSLRLGKFLLYDVTIVFGTPSSSFSRRHWPMQGPQALASTVPPMDLSASI